MQRTFPVALSLLLLAASAEANIVRYTYTTADGRFPSTRVPQFLLCDTEAELPVIDVGEGDLAYTKDTNKLWKHTETAWVDVSPGGGGAPTDATYLTQTSNGTLSAEQAMGLLGTGIVINTTTTGVQSIYGGTSCTNQFPRSLSASGAATCATVALSTDTSGTLAVARGGTGVTSATNDNVLVGDVTNTTWVQTQIFDCTGAGKALTYLAGSNSFGCNTISAGTGLVKRVVWTSSDNSTTSMTFIDVPELNSSGAGIATFTAYTFTCEIAYDSSSGTTTAIGLSVNGPSSPALLQYTVQTATSASTTHFASQTAYDTVTLPSDSGGTLDLPARVTGVLQTGASVATEFTLRFRSENGGTVTIKQGSHCMLTDVS